MQSNEELLGRLYRHVVLVDGNDERGTDVGIMTGTNFGIDCIRSNVEAEDAVGQVFSRDCLQYEVQIHGGTVLQILVNHFKSQAGKGGVDQVRKRQATEVCKIVNRLVAQGQHVVVMRDLNEGPSGAGTQVKLSRSFS